MARPLQLADTAMIRLPRGTVAKLRDRAALENCRPSDILRRAVSRELSEPSKAEREKTA